MIYKGKILLKKSAGVALMILLAGASVAAAALTFTGTAMTGDAGTTIDVGSGNTLSIQTTANGPVTFGSGLITFTTASGTNLGLANVSSSNVSSTAMDVTRRFTAANVSSTHLDASASSTINGLGIGTSPVSAILTIGAGSTEANCSAFYTNNTTTLLYLTITTTSPNGAGYLIAATSSRPTTCN